MASPTGARVGIGHAHVVGPGRVESRRWHCTTSGSSCMSWERPPSTWQRGASLRPLVTFAAGKRGQTAQICQRARHGCCICLSPSLSSLHISAPGPPCNSARSSVRGSRLGCGADEDPRREEMWRPRSGRRTRCSSCRSVCWSAVPASLRLDAGEPVDDALGRHPPPGGPQTLGQAFQPAFPGSRCSAESGRVGRESAVLDHHRRSAATHHACSYFSTPHIKALDLVGSETLARQVEDSDSQP